MNLFYSSFSYVMLSSSKFFSLLKIIYLVFFSPKLIESILSINHLHLFADSFLKNIFNFHNILMLIKKMLVFSACRCMWLSDRACRVSFVYSKKKDKGTNIDPWGTPQFIVPTSGNTLSNETKKSSVCEVEWNHFIVSLETPMHLILCNKIYDLRCQKPFWRSLKIIAVYFLFSVSLKIMSLKQDKHVSVEWFALRHDW